MPSKKETDTNTLLQNVDCILSFKEHKMNVIYKTISMVKFPYSFSVDTRKFDSTLK